MTKKVTISAILILISPLIIGWAVWTTNSVYDLKRTEYNQLKIERKLDQLITKTDDGFENLHRKIDNFYINNNEQILELWKERNPKP